MCYDVETQLRRDIKTAIRKGAPTEDIDYLRHRLDKFIEQNGEAALAANEHYWTMGFQHQKIPVITADKPDELQFFHWGLIPSWCKDKETARTMAAKCLNSRSETMFEKPSFKASANEKRCIIPLSGYYEHHWVDSKGKEKVPYYVRHKEDRILFMAGLWQTWVNKETGEAVNTCSIVTTNANEQLSKVHNRNPADPRMLVILHFDDIFNWLSPIEGPADIEFIKSKCVPFPDDRLVVYPVPQLRGKNGVGDVPEASLPHQYNIIGLP